jgi:hypothetical protein
MIGVRWNGVQEWGNILYRQFLLKFSINLDFSKKECVFFSGRDFEEAYGPILFCTWCLYSLTSLLYYCCTGGTLWHLQSSYIIVEITSCSILLYLPPPILEIVSIGFIFLFSYINTYFYHIQPCSPFPYIPSPPTSTIPQMGPVLTSCSPFLKTGTFVCLR